METLKRKFEEELHAKIEVDNLLAVGEIKEGDEGIFYGDDTIYP